MQRVVMHLASDVRYDPRLPNYGQCWPTVATLAGHCHLGPRTVQKILRRLKALGILTVTDRRPMSNLYTLDVGVDRWEYRYPAGDQEKANLPKSREKGVLEPAEIAGKGRIEPAEIAGKGRIEQIEPILNQTECATSAGEKAAPSGPNGIPHSFAAQQALKRNEVREKRGTKEVRYLRNLHIHAKDVYEITLEHPDLAWQCMTKWGDEGGEIKGVLVERLRRIPEQAAAAQAAAQRQQEAERLKAAQEAADDAALQADNEGAAALRQLNSGRMALLSGAQQAAARQGAIKRLREGRDWRWLYDAYRVPIKRAAASAADWDALPGAVLPRRLEECLALALDALDKGELAVLPQDGDPPVVMGLYGPVVDDVELPARNGRALPPPAVEPAHVCEP